MQAFDKVDVAGMKQVEGEISRSEAHIVELNAQEVKFTDAISREKGKFDGLKVQAADLDQDELTDARLAPRPQMEREAQDRICKVTPDRRVSLAKYQAGVRGTDRALGEDGMDKRYQERKRGKEGQEKTKKMQNQDR